MTVVEIRCMVSTLAPRGGGPVAYTSSQVVRQNGCPAGRRTRCSGPGEEVQVHLDGEVASGQVGGVWSATVWKSIRPPGPLAVAQPGPAKGTRPPVRAPCPTPAAPP